MHCPLFLVFGRRLLLLRLCIDIAQATKSVIRMGIQSDVPVNVDLVVRDSPYMISDIIWLLHTLSTCSLLQPFRPTQL